jgi:hypothetical protein
LVVVIIASNVSACTPDEGMPVTGMPTQGNTEDFQQAETAITIATFGNTQPHAIVVGFNDVTESNPANPKFYRPSPNERTIFHGASLMGWSISTTNGTSFNYHSQLAPPPGWAVLFGDPGLTTSGEQVVYMSNLGSSDIKFPDSGQFTSNATGPSVTTILDGFCVARSPNGGFIFDDVKCFKRGICQFTTDACTNEADCGPNSQCNGTLYDGTALAADTKFVFFASTNVLAESFDVWRASSDGLDFQLLAQQPFPGMQMTTHPRLQIFERHLYILGHQTDGMVFASRLDLDNTTAVWSTPQSVNNAAAVVEPLVVLSDRSIRTANQFSFDIGMNPQTAMNELRVATTRKENNKLFIELSTCPADLSAGCSPEPRWTTGALPGDQWNPMLKVSGTPALWKLVFLSRDSAPNGHWVSVRHGNLAVTPEPAPNGTRILATSELIEPQIPCTQQDPLVNPSDQNNRGYWGDYNEMASLRAPGDLTGPSPRFIAMFTDNRTGCDFRKRFIAYMHDGAAVLQ